MPSQLRSGPLRICLTGALSKVRREIADDIQSAGHIWDEEMRSGTNILVMADPRSGSAKARKAAQLGTYAIDEIELYTILDDRRIPGGPCLGDFNDDGRYVIAAAEENPEPTPVYVQPKPSRGGKILAESSRTLR